MRAAGEEAATAEAPRRGRPPRARRRSTSSWRSPSAGSTRSASSCCCSGSLMRVLIGVVVLGHGTNLLLQLVGGPPARVPIVGNSAVRDVLRPVPAGARAHRGVITFASDDVPAGARLPRFGLIGHDEVQDDLRGPRGSPAAGARRRRWRTGGRRRTSRRSRGRRPRTRRGDAAMTRPRSTLPVLLPILGAALTARVRHVGARFQRILALAMLGAVAAIAAVLLVAADRSGPVVAALGGFGAARRDRAGRRPALGAAAAGLDAGRARRAGLRHLPAHRRPRAADRQLDVLPDLPGALGRGVAAPTCPATCSRCSCRSRSC